MRTMTNCSQSYSQTKLRAKHTQIEMTKQLHSARVSERFLRAWQRAYARCRRRGSEALRDHNGGTRRRLTPSSVTLVNSHRLGISECAMQLCTLPPFNSSVRDVDTCFTASDCLHLETNSSDNTLS